MTLSWGHEHMQFAGQKLGLDEVTVGLLPCELSASVFSVVWLKTSEWLARPRLDYRPLP